MCLLGFKKYWIHPFNARRVAVLLLSWLVTVFHREYCRISAELNVFFYFEIYRFYFIFCWNRFCVANNFPDEISVWQCMSSSGRQIWHPLHIIHLLYIFSYANCKWPSNELLFLFEFTSIPLKNERHQK